MFSYEVILSLNQLITKWFWSLPNREIPIFSILLGLISGSFGYFLFSFYQTGFIRSETRTWALENLKRYWKFYLLKGAFKGILGPFVMGLAVGLLTAIRESDLRTAINDLWLIPILITFDETLLIAASLCGGCLGLFEAGFSNQFFLKISHPYQRFTASLKNLKIVFFKHCLLRLLLFLQSSFPLCLVYFLNEMSRRHLLEFDGNLDTESGGGTWRWRHRIIQEYFLKKKE